MSPHLLLNHILKCTFILLLRAQHVSCVISPLVCLLFPFLFYFYVSAFFMALSYLFKLFLFIRVKLFLFYYYLSFPLQLGLILKSLCSTLGTFINLIYT